MGIMPTIYAQPKVDNLPNGGTKTTTEETDATGTRTKLEEYRNAEKTLTGYKKWVTDLQGNTIYTDSATTAGGRPQHVKVYKVTPGGDTTYRQERNYDKKGKLIEYQIREYDKNKVLNKVTKWREGEKPEVNTAPEYDPMPLSPSNSIYKWEGRFVPNASVSGGYSYLNAGTSGDNISFPLGVHVKGTLNVTDALGLSVDYSFHTKKDMDFRITRSFLMAGVEYNFRQKDPNDFFISPHVLAGLVFDKQKYLPGDDDMAYKEDAFAFGVGLLLGYPICKRANVFVNPDYIFTRFNDDTQGNLRITGGIRYLFDF
jgi:hypothetical protein